MKKTIAVIFGGNSTEYDVSLQSAFSILENLDPGKYDIIPIGITRQGDWYRYNGAYDELLNDSWHQQKAWLVPVVVSQNPSVGGILELGKNGWKLTRRDLDVDKRQPFKSLWCRAGAYGGK